MNYNYHILLLGVGILLGASRITGMSPEETNNCKCLSQEIGALYNKFKKLESLDLAEQDKVLSLLISKISELPHDSLLKPALIRKIAQQILNLGPDHRYKILTSKEALMLLDLSFYMTRNTQQLFNRLDADQITTIIEKAGGPKNATFLHVLAKEGNLCRMEQITTELRKRGWYGAKKFLDLLQICGKDQKTVIKAVNGNNSSMIERLVALEKKAKTQQDQYLHRIKQDILKPLWANQKTDIVFV